MSNGSAFSDAGSSSERNRTGKQGLMLIFRFTSGIIRFAFYFLLSVWYTYGKNTIGSDWEEYENMDRRKIENFIDKQKVSFICSIDDENYPNVKAMLKFRKRRGLKEFYFSTNTSSMRVSQYRKNPHASIYFYHKGLIRYIGIMFKGKMEVLTDQEIKNAIWEKGDTIFYKGGVTDPDYCVLKFTAISGRYYCDLKTENFEVE